MPLTGYQVREINYRILFYIIIFFAIGAFASVLYWQSEADKASDFQKIPISKNFLKKDLNGVNY